MISYLTGKLLFTDLTSAVVDVHGVGYRVRMPLSDLARLGEPGTQVQVHVHTHVREDALELFAFSNVEGLQLFEHLIAVSGVGARMALNVLSGLEHDEAIQCILQGDEARLTKIPHVGKKTAARIVLELKDKLAKQGVVQSTAMPNSGPLQDLRSALENLGYKPAQIDRAVKAVEPMSQRGDGLSELVREALRHVG